ncbi:MAG: hypothetical protein AAF351_02565 [Pseudomonadota bacterium]
MLMMDDPNSKTEDAIRFGIGFAVGLFLFGFGAVAMAIEFGGVALAIVIIGALASGYASVKYRGGFWRWFLEWFD